MRNGVLALDAGDYPPESSFLLACVAAAQLPPSGEHLLCKIAVADTKYNHPISAEVQDLATGLGGAWVGSLSTIFEWQESRALFADRWVNALSNSPWSWPRSGPGSS